MKLLQLRAVNDATLLTDLTSGQVTELQIALDQVGYDIQGIDGVIGPITRAAWAKFKAESGSGQPDLIGPSSVQLLQQRLDDGIVPSGPAWVHRFPNSTSVEDLRTPFKDALITFREALRAAGVTMQVTSTLRPPQRAYLMHYAKAIATGDTIASFVPKRPDVPIQWVHVTNAASVAAAQGMVDAYGIMGPVALDSRHIEGHAIDMFISWSGTPTVQKRDGSRIDLTGAPTANNPVLVEVGASFGVVRGINIAGDPEHWSIDGA